MALIKNAQAERMAREAIVLDLGDLARQGRAMMEEARREATRIVEEAKAERDRIMAGAAEKGHAKGYAEGLAKGEREGGEKGHAAAVAEGKKQLDVLTQGWGKSLQEFEGVREELLAQTQRDVLRLALLIATRVTKRAVRIDPEIAVAQTRAVLEMIVRPTGVVLTVSPQDRAVVERALPGIVSGLSMVRHAELREDAAVSRGSVVLRNKGNGSGAGGGAVGGGEIDATIETQIERIVETLMPEMARGEAVGENQEEEGAEDGAAGEERG